MLDNKLAGKLGLLISLILWLVCLWRVAFHLKGRGDGSSSSSSWEWLTHRRAFHTLLWLAMTVECVAYADVARLVPLSENRVFADKVGYVLLEVAGRAMFEYNSFSVVSLLWFGTAIDVSTVQRSRLGAIVPRLLLGTGLFLAIVSVFQAGDILCRPEPSAAVYRFHLAVEGFSWAVQAGIAAICAWLTCKRILRLSTLPQSGNFKILAKSLAPMILCAACYSTRAVWLLCTFLRMPTRPLPDRFGVFWWVCFVWIPTLIPSVMLVYSARKRDPLDVDHDRREPLLQTPVPPAEAFMSFRRFREQGDLFSPLTADHRLCDEEEKESEEEGAEHES